MPYGLRRYQSSKQSHFVTFICYRRMQQLGDERLRDLFVECPERTRCNYSFRIYGYEVMPEHVHLLISEPEAEMLAKAIQALKISVARRAKSGRDEASIPFWQKRYYDHNVRGPESFVRKLRYIRRNPVKRGLAQSPENWQWSSFRHYVTAETGPVEIESQAPILQFSSTVCRLTCRRTADRRNGRTPKPLTIEEQ